MLSDTLEKLLDIVKKLRDPNEGCPWDQEQTHTSLIPYFKEELYEFLDELEQHGPDCPDTHEELGDVFFQILFHCQLFEEKGYSSFEKIADKLGKKLMERHPHVFDPKGPRYSNATEVNLAWESLKAKQRSETGPQIYPLTRALKKIPHSMAALQASARIGEKAAAFGFDWKRAEDAWEKVREEIAECEEAESLEHRKEELGDLLFAIAQHARLAGIDPEEALQSANRKFRGRIEKMEAFFEQEQTNWTELSLSEMESYWQRTKSQPSPLREKSHKNE